MIDQRQLLLSESGLENMLLELRTRMYVLSAFVSVVLMVIINLMFANDTRMPNAPIVAAVMGLLLSLLTLVNLRRQFAKQVKSFKEYAIIYDDEKIVRHQPSTPVLTIPFSEITKVTHHSDGTIDIRGKERHTPLVVIRWLDGKSELLAVLERHASIQFKQVTALAKFMQGYLAIVIMLAVGFMILSDNKIVAVIVGLGVSALLVVAWVMTLRSKSNHKVIERNLWTVPLMVAGLLMLTYFKVFMR